jgi:predicted XRE-type DNA-binding protein
MSNSCVTEPLYRTALRQTGITFSRLASIPQPRLSKPVSGKIAGMSTDTLLDAITKLGEHVTIRVERHASPSAGERVEMELA